MVGVEPELAADARDSLRRGGPVAWPAAGVVTDIITVAEDEMLAAVRQLARQARLIAEPGGAAAVAACLYHADELPEARMPVALLSGGNIDPQLLASILASD